MNWLAVNREQFWFVLCLGFDGKHRQNFILLDELFGFELCLQRLIHVRILKYAVGFLDFTASNGR
jgi:hypothetical protein